MLVMFGMVATQGIRMLAHVDFTNESNLLVVAMSVGLGLGVTVVPELFAGLPETVQLFTSNGIVVASLTSIILNILFNKKERGKVDLETSTVGSEFAETGNSH